MSNLCLAKIRDIEHCIWIFKNYPSPETLLVFTAHIYMHTFQHCNVVYISGRSIEEGERVKNPKAATGAICLIVRLIFIPEPLASISVANLEWPFITRYHLHSNTRNILDTDMQQQKVDPYGPRNERGKIYSRVSSEGLINDTNEPLS